MAVRGEEMRRGRFGSGFWAWRCRTLMLMGVTWLWAVFCSYRCCVVVVRCDDCGDARYERD